MEAGKTIRLRPYQQECIESVLECFRYENRVLVVSAVGTGKTQIFTEIARRWTQGRVVVLAHRGELIEQAAKKIFETTGEWPAIEMASQFSNEGSVWGRSQYVVCSVQSMHERRLTPERFQGVGLVIVDEAHHASSKNTTYGRVIAEFERRNPGLKLLGVSATPDRRDGEKLLFDRYAFRFPLKDAIDEGWLVEVKSHIAIINGMDFSRVRRVNGDLSQAEIAKIMEAEQPLQEVAVTTVKVAGDRKTVVFCASVPAAEATCSIINRMRPGKAKWICGDQQQFPKPLRTEILKQFDAGEIQFLVNHSVVLEGVDIPSVEVISWARPTSSPAVYTQGIGRGTRPLKGVVDAPGLVTIADRKAAIADSAKPFCLVLDFVDQSRRVDVVSVCHPDVLGGRFSEAEVAKAKENIERKSASGEPADIDEELEAARKMIQQQEEAEAARKRREEEEERKRREDERRKGIVADVDFSLVEHDLFDARSKGSGRELGIVRGDPATEKQARWLEEVGINPNSVNRKQAQGIINQIRQGTFKGRRKPQGSAASPDEVNRLLAEAARG